MRKFVGGMAGLSLLGLIIYACSTRSPQTAPTAQKDIDLNSPNVPATNKEGSEHSDQIGSDNWPLRTYWVKSQNKQIELYRSERAELLPIISSDAFSRQQEKLQALLADSDSIQILAERKLRIAAAGLPKVQSWKDESRLFDAMSEQYATHIYVGYVANVLEHLDSQSKEGMQRSTIEWLGKDRQELNDQSSKLSEYAPNQDAIAYCGIAPNDLAVLLNKAETISKFLPDTTIEDVTGAWITSIHSKLIVDDAAAELNCLDEWVQHGRGSKKDQPMLP